MLWSLSFFSRNIWICAEKVISGENGYVMCSYFFVVDVNDICVRFEGTRFFAQNLLQPWFRIVRGLYVGHIRSLVPEPLHHQLAVSFMPRQLLTRHYHLFALGCRYTLRREAQPHEMERGKYKLTITPRATGARQVWCLYAWEKEKIQTDRTRRHARKNAQPTHARTHRHIHEHRHIHTCGAVCCGNPDSRQLQG